jgi:hypothetical protein
MWKPALTVALLLFVAASVAATLVREYVTPAPQSDAMPLEMAPGRPDAIVVLYLRSRIRCAACSTLEACSRDVVEQEFAGESATGMIAWRAIDYQTPGNEHYVSDFQLPTGGVVLLEFRGGKLARWKALLHAWNLTGNRAVLGDYLATAVRQFGHHAGMVEDGR